MSLKVGGKTDFIDEYTLVISFSGWIGDSFLKKSDNVP